MNRLRRWSVVCSLYAALAVSLAFAQPAGEDKWLVDRALTVTPQAAPAESLRYRLFPLAFDRKEGNAVPIYLRLIHEQSDEAKRYWTDNPKKWNEMPAGAMPMNEVHTFLDRMKNFYIQFDYGARRRTADWGYTIEQPNPVEILMPDVQKMRSYVPMLVLRARVRTAEGDYDAAARAFETCFGFSRHVGDGPFLISGLVGIACASQVLDQLPEWIERPGSPNLYWSLTALPTPLIDLRGALDLEQRVLEMQFPELRDNARPRSAAEWDAKLKRFRAEIKYVYPYIKGEKAIDATDPDEPASKSSELPAAKKYVAERGIVPQSDSHALLLYVIGKYDEFRDAVFRATYLPYPQSRAEIAAYNERFAAAPDGEAKRIAQMFLPAVAKVGSAQIRIDRKVAALRVVEALRMHAAANGGSLPASLAEVKVVPVPDDPGTGRPFEYRVDGGTATVTGRIAGEPLATAGLRYRVTLKK